MKICDDHWQQLRQAIDDRGLTAFVSKDGEHAARSMVSQMQDGAAKDNFDPLMSATFMIWGNALEAFGTEIVQPNAPCPLCVLDKHAKECTEEGCQMKQTGADWIGFAADGQVEAAKELGLLGEPN